MSSASHTPSAGSQQNPGDHHQEITADPLIPKPLEMGHSIVHSSPSPLGIDDSTETTLRWRSDEAEPSQKSPFEKRSQVITIPIEQKTLRRTLDVESTDEWIAPKVSPLTETNPLESSLHASLQLEGSHQYDGLCFSNIERQLYQISITTPPLKWTIMAKVSAGLSTAISLFILIELGAQFPTDLSLSNLSIYTISGLILLFTTFGLALWYSQCQQVIVNQAQVTYRRLYWFKISRSATFPFSELQEVSERLPIQSSTPQPSSISLVGKNKVFTFGADLPDEEKQYLLESLKEKVVDLQQGIYR